MWGTRDSILMDVIDGKRVCIAYPSTLPQTCGLWDKSLSQSVPLNDALCQYGAHKYALSRWGNRLWIHTQQMGQSIVGKVLSYEGERCNGAAGEKYSLKSVCQSIVETVFLNTIMKPFWQTKTRAYQSSNQGIDHEMDTNKQLRIFLNSSTR